MGRFLNAVCVVFVVLMAIFAIGNIGIAILTGVYGPEKMEVSPMYYYGLQAQANLYLAAIVMGSVYARSRR